jgi:hypothetical protein
LRERAPARPAAPSGEPNCGYYLRHQHNLIRRHEESLSLSADNTARWGLRIDLELPDHPEALHTGGDDVQSRLLFPLVYLRKNESRMQFSVYEEGAGSVPIPIRAECDEISSRAIAQAIDHLASEINPAFRFEDEEFAEFDTLIHKIPSEQAFEASKALQSLRAMLGIIESNEHEPSDLFGELGARMVASGLDETLSMLVEHAMLWVPLRGWPGERRSISLTQEITLRRRSMLRWSFGRMTMPKHPCWHWRWRRIAEGKTWRKESLLDIAGKPYGRRDWRFSASALGERIGQPLAWMPFEFALPTIYAKRCRSYHLEVRCPPGRTPRDLRVAGGPILEESEEAKPKPVEGSRVKFSSRSARFDIPRGGLDDVTRIRVIVGIGDGAFPLLWFLAGAITTVMLWILAASDSQLSGEHAQTTAGILLIVPALVAGLAATNGDVPISQLIGGSRTLLLATGLSSVVAASVLAGMRPFDLGPASVWSACAMAATIATVPLATSWLLSSSLVWREMRRLNSYKRQRLALYAGLALAIAAIVLLAVLSSHTWARAFLAGFLLLLMIVFSALANNRAAMQIGNSRRYLGFSFLLAGLICLGLACIELRCVIYQQYLDRRAVCTGPAADWNQIRIWAEGAALILLAVTNILGDVTSFFAGLAKPRDDEVHVSPRRLHALLAGDSVRELSTLFDREREAGKRTDITDRPEKPPQGVI